MKKLIVGLIYLPFTLLAAILSIVFLIWELTVSFTYNQAIEWKNKMLCKVSDNLNKIK